MTVKVTKPALNLREELSSLKKPSGVAGEAMLRAETPQEQFNLIGAGRKNLIINGNFDVWQRGTNFTESNAYTADRWKMYSVGVTSSQEKTTDGTYKITATSSATGTARIYQLLELDFDKKGWGGKTFTASAWVKSNSSNARLELYPSAGVGWSGFEAQHSGNGTWEYLSFTFVMPNNTDINSVSLQAGLDGYNSADVAITSGEYFEIKEVQLELGSVATPFEHRSYGEELALCQRYYYRVNGSTGRKALGAGWFGSAYNFYAYWEFPVPMRTTPAITYSSTSIDVGYNNSVLSNRNILAGFNKDEYGVVLSVDVTGMSTGNAGLAYLEPVSTAYVAADAEL